MGRLTNKTIIVTGAASGIGRACAELFVREGANVLLGDINESGGQTIAAQLGEQALFVKLDTGVEADWENAIEAAQKRWSRVDGIGNIAGIDVNDDDVERCRPDQWRKVQRVNLDGVFLGTKHGVLAMKSAGGGSIVNISSIFALVSDPFGESIAYTASKGGVRLLTKSAAMHCAKHRYGIRVNSIHPGFIETPMVADDLARAADPEVERAAIAGRHPIGRLGRPEEIANAALYLLSDESAFVTGAEFAIDGGYTAV